MVSHLERVARKQEVLLDSIPLVSDVQSAWLLLLHFASARANFQLRVVRPTAVENFARTHDALWWCLWNLLQTDLAQCDPAKQEAAPTANVSGRSGVAQGHPHKCRGILGQLVRLPANDPSPTPCRRSTIGPSIGRFPSIPDLARGCHGQKGIDGCCRVRATDLGKMAAGMRPPERELEDFEPGWV